jgi:F0F1-type ATP synthase membrane subunit b/b'
MTRDEAKKILGENATEEQVTNLLNSFHNSEKAKNDKIAELEKQLTGFSDYNEIKKKLDDINQANMSEQEKLEAQKQEIAKNLAESRRIVNTAKAKEILAGEEIDDEIIASLVSDNLDNTVAKATKMKQTLSTLRDNVSKKTKEELTNINLDPSMSNVNPNQNDVMTIEKFNNLSADEQEKFIAEHPTEFENL